MSVTASEVAARCRTSINTPGARAATSVAIAVLLGYAVVLPSIPTFTAKAATGVLAMAVFVGLLRGFCRNVRNTGTGWQKNGMAIIVVLPFPIAQLLSHAPILFAVPGTVLILGAVPFLVRRMYPPVAVPEMKNPESIAPADLIVVALQCAGATSRDEALPQKMVKELTGLSAQEAYDAVCGDDRLRQRRYTEALRSADRKELRLWLDKPITA